MQTVSLRSDLQRRRVSAEVRKLTVLRYNWIQWVVGQFRCKCPINFSLSRRYDKLKLIGHQTDPLPSNAAGSRFHY